MRRIAIHNLGYGVGSIFVAILLLGSAVVYWRSTPTMIYLPDNASQHNASDILDNLPIRETFVPTLYGLARVFHTTGGTAIYELAARSGLNASRCPNVTRQASLNPSRCVKIDSFHSYDLFEMNRSDAKLVSEQFITINHTFVVVVFSSYGPNYIHTLVQLPQSQVPGYLIVNQKLAAKAQTAMKH